MPNFRVPGSLSEIVHPSQTALIVWDMQVGIGARAHNRDSLLSTLRALIEGARRAGVLVVWSQHIAPPPEFTSRVGLWTLMRRQGVTDVTRVSPFMQRGTPEVELIPEFVPAAGELVLEKSTPSFFVGTPLEQRLRARGIETLVLTGVATEQGIEFTARHAIALGFFAVVVEDAVGSFSSQAHELGLAALRTTTQVIEARAVLDEWGRTR